MMGTRRNFFACVGATVAGAVAAVAVPGFCSEVDEPVVISVGRFKDQLVLTGPTDKLVEFHKRYLDYLYPLPEPYTKFMYDINVRVIANIQKEGRVYVVSNSIRRALAFSHALEGINVTYV